MHNKSAFLPTPLTTAAPPPRVARCSARANPQRRHAASKAAAQSTHAHTQAILTAARRGDLSLMERNVKQAQRSGYVLNAVNYTTIANAYATHGNAARGLATLVEMRRREIPPTNVTLRVAIKVCEKLHATDALTDILDWTRSCSLESPDVKSWNMALKAVGDGGRMMSVLEGMEKMGPVPDVWSYNVVMRACGLREAVEVWGRMVWRGVVPDLVSYNTVLEVAVGERKMPWGVGEFVRGVIRGLGRRGDLTTETLLLRVMCRKEEMIDATMVRERMKGVKERLKPDKKYFDALITAFANARDMNGVADAFQLMLQYQIQPDLYTVRAVLHAASTMGDVDLAKTIVALLDGAKICLDDVLYTCAISACARSKPSQPVVAHQLLQHAFDNGTTWTPAMLNAAITSHGSAIQSALSYWKSLQQCVHEPSRLSLTHRVVYDALMRVSGRSLRADVALRIWYAAKNAKHVTPNTACSRALYNAFQKGISESSKTPQNPLYSSYITHLQAECGVRDYSQDLPIHRIRIKL